MESGDVLASCTSLYSIGRARKKLLLSCSNPRPDSCLGKISRRACAFLDESLAWVLTEVALLRMHNIYMQQPASPAILRRSARSIPMFRADFLSFASKTVEHSRYLPVEKERKKHLMKYLLLFCATPEELAAWQALSEEARAQTRAKSGQWITSLCWLARWNRSLPF